MSKALVIFSGGQDSTTVAAYALKHHDEVYALTINYNQRHRIELEQSLKLAIMLGMRHEILNLGPVLQGRSPLVSPGDVSTYETPDEMPDGIAETFVPSRNALFLTLASNRAVCLGADTIYTGVSQTDYSGYPDCRREFIDAMEVSLSVANFGEPGHIKIATPLMDLTKAQTVWMAQQLLGENFVNVMGETHTCYQGVRGGCGKCAACLLRDRGFLEAGVSDPIWRFRPDGGRSVINQPALS